MHRYKNSSITVILILALGAASAAKASKPQLALTTALDGSDVTDFCDAGASTDGLFQIVANHRVCIVSALKRSIASPKEKVALLAVASSYLDASKVRRTKPLPLPLQVLGTMVADTVTTNLEARHADPALLRPSSLRARDFPSNEGETVNWAAIGLARAQAAGSCEAVTVGLFKKIARDANLSVEQRSEAGRVLRAFGVASLHPDDRCIS